MIVLVEDDIEIGEAVQTALQARDYVVRWFTTGAAATAALERHVPDLVLLDIGLPDIDGVTICRWLRDLHRSLPIVLLTARDSEIDTVVGLDAGATDYVTKPFSMQVLVARVRAHLRTADIEGEDSDAVVELGSLQVDPAAYVARVGGQPVSLRPREFELLIVLSREAGKVVTRERLMSEVWDLHWDSTSKTLNMHVMALRRKLGAAVSITSVRGVGYRMDTR
ncbi:MAG: two component transcriptional regulator, winged helix family [Acidimicrobiales bacterium]|nr:two component transcriptional regulator, winged helix family [Acidimicrobiales bacterium]